MKVVLNEDNGSITESSEKLKRYTLEYDELLWYIKQIEEAFDWILFVKMLFWSVLMCISMFPLTEPKVSTTMKVFYGFYIITVAVELLLYTFTCDELLFLQREVAESVFYNGWHFLREDKVGKSVKNAIQMLILRSQRPVQLTAKKFVIITRNLCTNIMSTTLSYLHLLRNVRGHADNLQI